MLWMHRFVASQGPSQLLPKTLFLWFATIFETRFAFITGGISTAYDTNGKSLFNQLGALMLASKGVFVISPDYIEYGQDKTLYKRKNLFSCFLHQIIYQLLQLQLKFHILLLLSLRKNLKVHQR